ncbi:LysR substrate-binding domain-containing protein [Sphingomonas sp. MMS24-JH45]
MSGFLSPSKREADVAVLLARPAQGPVVASKLADYALHLYASAGYIAANGEPSRETLAARHRLVGDIPDLPDSPELRYLREVDAGLAPQLRLLSINAQARLVASGAGVGVLPHFIGGADPALVRVVPEVTIALAFWPVTHRDTRQLRRVRAFRARPVELVTRHRGRLMP